MEKQFKYIIELAKEFQTYENDDQALFDVLQNLNQDQLSSIYEEYGDPARQYQPVNLLRAEVAGRLLHGEEIDSGIVEEIKQNIIQIVNKTKLYEQRREGGGGRW